MPDAMLLPVALTLITLLVSAGVLLRMTASIVYHYATRQGTPYLSHGVQILGLGFIGTGLSIGVIAVLFGVLEAGRTPEYMLTSCAIILTGFLVCSGAFLWRWGLSFGVDQGLPAKQASTAPSRLLDQLVIALIPIRDAERGASLATLLSWTAAMLSVVFCLASIFEPWILFFLFPLELACLGLLFILECVLWWNRRGHRQILRFWQIYLAVHSGRSLTREIDFLSEYAWGAERQRLMDVNDELHGGGDVEAAIVRPLFLSNLEGAQIATGLKAGRMPQVIREMLERRITAMNELQGSHGRIRDTLYLWAISLVLLNIVGFIMYWIIPKFKKIFDDFGTELPDATKVIIRASDTFVNYWYLLFPFMILLLVGQTLVGLIPFARNFPRLRIWYARLWPRVCMPDVLRSLALATESQLSLEEALGPFAGPDFLTPLHHRLVRVREAVREGSDCWIELADQKLLTTNEAALLRSAQAAGNLPWALRALSERFEQRWYFRLLFWLEFLQPAILIAVAFIVGFIVIAFFLPLVKLINDLS